MASTSNTPTGVEAVTGPAELVLAPDALLSAAADQLVEQAKATCVALTGEGGLLTGLVQRVLQGALEFENRPRSRSASAACRAWTRW